MLIRALVVSVVVCSAVPAFAQDGAALYAQHCATCHDGAARAPSRQIIGLLTADRIVASLTSGLMRTQGQSLSADERTAIARFLSTAPGTAPAAASSLMAAPKCSAPGKPTASAADWTSWGVTLANERFQKTPGFTAAQ